MKKKTIVLLAILAGLILLPLAAGVVVRNIILRQVQGQVEAHFEYSRIKLSVFPPLLVIENIRSKPGAPNFSAHSVSLSVPLRSLLSSDRRVSLAVERPVFRLSETAAPAGEPFEVEIPFAVERGVIHEGEFHYRGRVRVRARGVNAYFNWRKDRYAVQARIRESVIFLPGVEEPLTGFVRLSLEGGQGAARIRRLTASGPSLYLRIAGDIGANKPFVSFAGDFNLKSGWLADYLDLPFSWTGEVRGSGRIAVREGRLEVGGDLDSRNLAINRVPLGKVRGRIEIRESGEGRLDLAAESASGRRQDLRLSFLGARIEGRAENLFLDPVMRDISLPWPVRSAAWGGFVLQDGRLEAEAEFRDDVSLPGSEPDRFPLQGAFTLNWDGKDRIRFRSPEMDSSFGRLSLDADLDIGRTFDMRLSGQVKDVKLARRFTSLMLVEDFDFPEIRGRGNAEIRISGPFSSPRVRMKFFLFPGALDRLEADFVEGTADIDTQEGEVTVSCRADDPELMGQADVSVGPESWKADIGLSRGLVERLFPALDIPLPLRGEGRGEFEIVGRDDRVSVSGEFSSPRLALGTQTFTEVKGAVVYEEDEELRFPSLEMTYSGGRVSGTGRLGLADDTFSLDVSGSELDLAGFEPGLKGFLSFRMTGGGVLGKDPVQGTIEIRNPGYGSVAAARAEGEGRLLFSDEILEASWKGLFRPGDNDCTLSFAYRFTDRSYSADIKGSFSELDILLPWKGARGQVNYLAEIRGPSSEPGVKGVVDFQGSLLPIPDFSQAVNDYSGLVFIEGRSLSLRSFQGTLGGGPVQATGELLLGRKGEDVGLDFTIEGQGMRLAPLARTRALADGRLRLVKDSDRFVLDGNFDVQSLSWRRELSEEFSFSSEPYYQPDVEKDFFDDLTLNINLRAEDNAWVENSLGRARGRFDLNVTGSVADPILLGEVELFDGYVFFQDRKFTLLRGNLRFFNPMAIDPYLDFRGETYVKDYRVTFSLSGLLDHLKTEFTSSPPLPPEDVLALLVMGEAFKRTYRAETSAQLSSATLVTLQLFEEAKKRATKLLSIDRFRIDPFILGTSSEMTARLTVGKRISRNLFIYYSTNLSTQREEIVRMEWEIGDNLSLVGIRDELGRMSLDFKVRKRF